MATQSITLCVPHGESFAAARAAATNIYKILERIPMIDSLSPSGETPPRVRGEIALDDVYFNYPSRPDVKILKGLSLRVKPGETVALVGSSGCGKSTILQLVQRLYDPQSGSVKIDGRDIKNLNLSWLRATLGVVGQEPVLFRGTIHENIAIGTPNATRENVQKVAEMAFAHDFITHLSDAYDTMIGERGASLSGGQKQRIAIARSLLRDPAILLLDEATSALDPHSEKQVQAALDRACVGRTTLVVSHRLSTIVNASRIICMDQGIIVEQGTHEELMKAKGSYWKLVTTGNEGKEPDVIETVPEEEENVKEPALQSRVDIKRRFHDWMTPRGSISSVMSTGLQNFAYNIESDSEDSDKEDDERIPPVNDWQLLKLNGPEWPLLVVGSIAAFIQGACFPMFALLFGLAIGVFAYEDNARTLRDSAVFSGMFIVIAAVAGVTMCLQSVTFTTAGLKMTTRLRVQCFSSYLKQEIGYFDRAKNAVGSLCARLSGDAAEVQGATGLRIGLIIQGVSSVSVGFIMGCCYSWKLTFVGAAFLPL
ncbi:Multidrug resistance protein 1, partial [Eumeta japonica]